MVATKSGSTTIATPEDGLFDGPDVTIDSAVTSSTTLNESQANFAPMHLHEQPHKLDLKTTQWRQQNVGQRELTHPKNDSSIGQR